MLDSELFGARSSHFSRCRLRSKSPNRLKRNKEGGRAPVGICPYGPGCVVGCVVGCVAGKLRDHKAMRLL